MIGRSLLFVGCGVLAASAAAAPKWERVWTVTRVICGSCSANNRLAFKKYIGIKIRIEPDQFVNPADESCRKGVVYSDVHQRTAAYARSTIPGLPPIGHHRVIAGWIGCGDASGVPNIVARVAFIGDSGYYLFENGAVFVLN